MSICYIVLTCEKYLPTRCEAIRNTWLRDVDHYFFLSAKSNPDKRVLGWDTPDDYQSCSKKYIDFFRNMTIDADWIVFCDDDTFVFPKRLKRALSALSPKRNLYIGYEFPDASEPAMSGGAGFVLSRNAYTQLCSYIRSANNEDVWVSTYTDISVSKWLQHTVQLEKIIDSRFHPYACKTNEDFKHAFTFHYISPSDMSIYYSKSLVSFLYK